MTKLLTLTDQEFIDYYKAGEGFSGVSDYVAMLREAMIRLEKTIIQSKEKKPCGGSELDTH